MNRKSTAKAGKSMTFLIILALSPFASVGCGGPDSHQTAGLQLTEDHLQKSHRDILRFGNIGYLYGALALLAG